MKILITGNPDKALANELSKIYPSAVFASRISDIDLTTTVGHKRLAGMSVDFDIFINKNCIIQTLPTPYLPHVDANFEDSNFQILQISYQTFL